MFDVCIENGRIVTPSGLLASDIYIEGDKISRITTEKMAVQQRVDASHCFLLPGSVDAHVHFMDPGYTDREDFVTGTASAALGGVTTVVDHHMTKPLVTSADVLTEKAKYLKGRAYVDYGLIAGLSHDNIDELRKLWDEGAIAFKGFTNTRSEVPGLSNHDLLNIFCTISRFGGVALIHAEDDSILRENEKNLRSSGREGYEIISAWRSQEAERIAVSNVSIISQLSGCKVVVAHTSHPEALDIITMYKKIGANVLCESCPHYFYLTEKDVINRGPFAKFTPPARGVEQKEVMWNRLSAGLIDMINSDHAPSTKAQKLKGDVWETPFGIPGVQTKLPLLVNGATKGLISLETVANVSATNVAKIYGLYPQKGAILPGSDADIVCLDFDECLIRNEDMKYKCAWTPYDGMKIRGRVRRVWLRGQLIVEHGELLGEPSFGKFIKGPGARDELP